MGIYTYECSNFNDCYRKYLNKTLEDEIVKQAELKTESLTSHKKPIIKPDITPEEASKIDEPTFDEIEMIENGLVWSIKSKLHVSQNHLVICIGQNDIGYSMTKRLIIPSELEKGLTFQTKLYNDRINDPEIVEGDDFHILYAFNNILYSANDYNFIAKPKEEPCGLDINPKPEISLTEENNFVYTKILKLRFNNVKKECNFNYTLKLKANPHPYFTQTVDKKPIHPTNPVISYNLNIKTPVLPSFVNEFNVSTDWDNETDFAMALSGSFNFKPDQNIVLNCDSRGKPRPSIVWLKDGQLLNLNDDKYKLIDGSLKIFRIHSVDAGLYECQATNRYGSASRSFYVAVETQKITIKELGRRQIAFIVLVSLCAGIFLILLIIASTYVVRQQRENQKLKVF